MVPSAALPARTVGVQAILYGRGMRRYLAKAMNRLDRPWSKLRGLVNSNAVKMTIFIPVVGYLLLLDEKLLHLVELSHDMFGKPEGRPFAVEHWRLLFVYFGLTAIAMASLIHQLCCPWQIKRFAATEDYIAEFHPHMAGVRFREMCRELSGLTEYGELEKKYAAMREVAGKIATSPSDLHDKLESERRNHERNVMDLHLRTLDKSRPWARRLSLALYTIGFAVLAIPTANVFAKVTVLALSAAVGWL